jgi:UDP-N-acetylglucosamine--N-acetylmuramyl-(pentapeptide) pyrophosphoryl-undecaprenol N-acetylglucosamine transferase
MQEMNQMLTGKVKGRRFIIAGGGTGGHIFPAIAIANALKKNAPQSVFLFVGATGKMEMEKVPQAGYEIKGLTIAGFNRSSLIKNISLPFKLLKSFFQVSSILKSFRPDAVIGVGGYSSFPVLRYAQSKGIPTFIHEANSFAGKSNMLLGKNATRIFTAIDGMEKFFPPEKISISGNPVRNVIAHSQVQKEDALRYFGLQKGKKTVLSVGGSLGAKSINEAIGKQLDLLLQKGIQLIWQTGTSYKSEAERLCKGHDGIYVNDFITEMPNAYAAADFVISRSGAMAVSELCIVGKPVIFVPYPYAAEDHQTVNAQKLVNNHAAMLIEDKEALNKLVPALLALTQNSSLQESLSYHISQMAIYDADQRIAEEILAYLN